MVGVHLVPYNVVPLFDHPIMWSSHYVIIPLCDHPIMWSSHYLIIPVFRLGGPMVGEQMRLDHGWWMGLWVMVQYGVHVIPLLFSPIQCRPIIWSSHYLIVPLFDHPAILIGWAHGWCTDEIRPWLEDGPMGYCIFPIILLTIFFLIQWLQYCIGGLVAFKDGEEAIYDLSAMWWIFGRQVLNLI